MSLTPLKSRNYLPVYFIPNYFSLSVKNCKRNTFITMRLFTESINTKKNPKTYSVLEQQLPSVFSSKCFNEQNLPFNEEVKNTEIGHLFEHILLEYLCYYKLLSGSDEAIFNGNTNWNWERDEFGTFHISIDSGKDNNQIFSQAIEKSVSLLLEILQKDPSVIN